MRALDRRDYLTTVPLSGVKESVTGEASPEQAPPPAHARAERRGFYPFALGAANLVTAPIPGQAGGPPCAPVKNLPTPYRKFLLPTIGRRRIINFCISASFVGPLITQQSPPLPLHSDIKAFLRMETPDMLSIVRHG